MSGQDGGIPYQVALFVDGSKFNCGGSIISPLLILTAAHCLDGFSKNIGRVTVIAGTRSPSVFGFVRAPSEQIRYPRKFYIHEKYKRSRGNAYDIGIIELTSPLQFTNEVASVCLPIESDEFSGKTIVSGWGRTDLKDPESGSKFLQYLILPIIPFNECQVPYGDRLKSHMFCIGEEGKDSCKGDSGGPAVCLRAYDQTLVLCGVVSWGIGCAKSGYPGVYIKVSHFLNWITQILPEHLSRTISCRQPEGEVTYGNPSDYDYIGSYDTGSSGIYNGRENYLGYQDEEVYGFDDNEAFGRSAGYVPLNQDIDIPMDYSNNNGDQWESYNGDDNNGYWED